MFILPRDLYFVCISLKGRKKLNPFKANFVKGFSWACKRSWVYSSGIPWSLSQPGLLTKNCCIFKLSPAEFLFSDHHLMSCNIIHSPSTSLHAVCTCPTYPGLTGRGNGLSSRQETQISLFKITQHTVVHPDEGQPLGRPKAWSYFDLFKDILIFINNK